MATAAARGVLARPAGAVDNPPAMREERRRLGARGGRGSVRARVLASVRARVLASVRSRALALAGAAVWLGGCEANPWTRPGVSFATEPPGARIVVDRRDSGFVTPCRLTLRRERHDVDLELPGYATARVRLDKDFNAEVVLWRDMYVRPHVWRFPTWLNLEDALWPVKPRFTLAPGHVFVRLDRAAAPARSEPATGP